VWSVRLAAENGGGAAAAGSAGVVAQRPGTQNKGWDEEHFNYTLRENKVIHDGRYYLQRCIGKGSFGRVVKVVDTRTNE
jgi:hypothetical protein